jgi:hypothetical protein
MNEWEWQALEDRTAVDQVSCAGGDVRVGSRVRLRPRPRGGDVMDLLLAGRTALVEAIEQDYEGAIHLALVFDDDPGRDLGLLRQPGHRFFYAPGEVEMCGGEPGDDGLDREDCSRHRSSPEESNHGGVGLEERAAAGVTGPDTDVTALAGSGSPAAQSPTILIAGIGNIFLGDDGFGVEVVRADGSTGRHDSRRRLSARRAARHAVGHRA